MDWFKNRQIRNEDGNFGVFVAHRDNEKRNHVTFDEWHYVPTDQNIADFTTRYQEFSRLMNSKNWFYEPDFLQAFEFNTFDKDPKHFPPKHFNKYRIYGTKHWRVDQVKFVEDSL